jgi:hypothetical protein
MFYVLLYCVFVISRGRGERGEKYENLRPYSENFLHNVYNTSPVRKVNEKHPKHKTEQILYLI